MQNPLRKRADSIPTRSSLLRRLRNWVDQDGWQDFFDTYWRLIYGTAIRAGLNEVEAQDVVQETVLAVAKEAKDWPMEPTFGSFKGWLLTITRRRSADQFRKRPRGTRSSWRDTSDGARTPTAEEIADPASLCWEAVWEEQWRQNLMELAMENVRRDVSPRQWVLFQQQTIKKRPSREVAELYGVSLAQVYMAKYRISNLIKKEVKALQRRIN